MEIKLFYKMVKNCLKQYLSEVDTLPFTNEELEEMYRKVLMIKETTNNEDLHEILQDVVYEYITNSPYF